MPKGDKKVEDNVSIEDWIEKFNKAKGWQSLKAPKPEKLSRRDGGEGFKYSPEKLLKNRIDLLGDPNSRSQADGLALTARNTLKQLELQLAGTDDEKEKAEIQSEIDQREQDLEEFLADVKLYDNLTKHLENLQKTEGTLSNDVKAMGLRLQQLNEEVEKKGFDLSTLDKEALARFRTFHEMVAGNIENARQEVMTFEFQDKNGKAQKNNYSIINSDEYKILFGMLEAAILNVQLGDLDKGVGIVQKTSEKLAEYRNARTGAQAIEQKESFAPELDDALIDAGLMIDSLRHMGYALAADKWKTLFDDLMIDLRGAKKSGDTKIAATFLKRCTALAEGATQDVGLGNDIKTLAGQARRDAMTMRANDHKSRPGRVEKNLEDFLAGVDLVDALNRMADIRKYAADKLEECMAEDLKRAKLDPTKLRDQLADLEKRYDKLFKHDKEGNVKTQKDTKTGQEKGVKKNSNIPRETLEEIELKILAARQLIDSESVAALRLAEGQLAEIERFLSNVTDHPKLYADFNDMITKLENELKKVGSDFALYEVSKRNDLKVAIDKIRKEYTTKPQKDVLAKITTQNDNVKDYKKLVTKLRGQKRAAIKQADEIGKTITSLGERLKKSYSNLFVEFDGYHGPLNGELSEIRSKIERRTKESLDEADKLIVALKTKADQMEKLLKTFKSSPGKLTGAEQDLARTFVKEARDGQTKHDDNMRQQETFEKGAKELESQLELLKGLQKKLKGDPSGREALESELESLVKGAKTERNYIEALEELKPLASRTAFMLVEATNATEIVDAELGKAAEMVVDRVNDFSKHIAGFYDKIVLPAAKTDTGNQLDDGPFDGPKVKKFFDSIVAAIPKKALDDLKKSVPVVANTALERSERLLARKTALASVRALTAVFDGFKPMNHFRINPFDDAKAAPAMGAARQALPRLELRLLTAIAE